MSQVQHDIKKLWLALILFACPTASAQIFDQFSNSTAPLEIEAYEYLEWDQIKQTYTAQGNATAKQGDTLIKAQTLIAHYKKDAGNQTQIYKIDALKQIEIITPDDHLTGGETGFYDLTHEYALVKGAHLHLTSNDKIIDAHEKIEFFDKQQKAVATGKASAQDAENKINAQTLTLYFRKDANGKNQATKMIGDQDVVLITPQDVIWADHANYDMIKELVQLKGHVRVSSGKNQLQGDEVEADLAKKTTRIKTTSPQGRTKALFIPNKQKSTP